MTARFVLSPRAVSHLATIWRHLKKEAGEHTADRIEAAIRSEFSYLADFPAAGHLRPDLTGHPVRFLAVYFYLIVYRPDRKPLEIVAVLHGKRDVSRLLSSAIRTS